jgi:hypothetical protein
MAEPYNEPRTPERYEETTDPRNPPNSLINEEVRRTALRSYLGPLVVFFVIAGIALIYWANRGPVVPDPEDRQQIGTTGAPADTPDVVGERGIRDDDTPGGVDPAPRPADTNDELRFRGVDQPARPLPGVRADTQLNGLAMLEGDPKNLVGRRIDLRDVNVVEARGGSPFWVQDGNHKVEVMAPRGAPAVKNGARVNVSGVVEDDGRGGVRIRAERIDMR